MRWMLLASGPMNLGGAVQLHRPRQFEDVVTDDGRPRKIGIDCHASWSPVAHGGRASRRPLAESCNEDGLTASPPRPPVVSGYTACTASTRLAPQRRTSGRTWAERGPPRRSRGRPGDDHEHDRQEWHGESVGRARHDVRRSRSQRLPGAPTSDAAPRGLLPVAAQRQRRCPLVGQHDRATV